MFLRSTVDHWAIHPYTHVCLDVHAKQLHLANLQSAISYNTSKR